jgi:APA family basic amino acid/polyamine antiporter
MAEPQRSKPNLGAFDIGCVVVGGIIGVGIFFTPQVVAARVGSATQVIAAWSVGAVIALLGALVFADLARRVPGHGGTFLYIARSFGRLPAFLFGWANWLAIQAGALGVIGLVLADNLDVLLFGTGHLRDGTKVAVAVGAVGTFTAVNALGLRAGRGVQNVLTVTKTLAVFGLVVLALVAEGRPDLHAPPEHADPPSWPRALAAALLPVLFAFGGWQQGSFLAGAARRPRRDVPLGIVAGVVVVVLAYLTVNLSFLDLLGFEGARHSRTIGVDAARVGLAPFGLGEVAARVLAGLIVVSALGILNTICLAPPFVLHAMAREGLFFRAVGVLRDNGSPIIAVLVQGAAGVAALLAAYFASGSESLRTLDFLLDGVVFVDWLFFALCGLALLRLRARAPTGSETWSGALVPAAFTLAAAAVACATVATRAAASAAGLAVCAAGALVYALVMRRPGPIA